MTQALIAASDLSRTYPGRAFVERIVRAHIPAGDKPELAKYVACFPDLTELDLATVDGEQAYGLAKLKKLQRLRI